MSKYIGFKMIEAEPQSGVTKEGYPSEEGYRVVYPDGYISWSPKDVFEKAYMQVGDNNTITQEMVDAFITRVESHRMGDKTTFVLATLANGFVLTKSSSCVDPLNYNHEIGEDICMEKIKNQVWMLLGFLLQTAKDGIK